MINVKAKAKGTETATSKKRPQFRWAHAVWTIISLSLIPIELRYYLLRLLNSVGDCIDNLFKF